MRSWKITGIIATLIIVVSIPAYVLKATYFQPPAEPTSPAVFVGGQKCGECHKNEYDKWRGSHHDLAMDEANETTVLGNFDDAVFKHLDVTSRFYRKDGRFFVNTQGPQGKMDNFEVKYVFGVFPLQIPNKFHVFDRQGGLMSDGLQQLLVDTGKSFPVTFVVNIQHAYNALLVLYRHRQQRSGSITDNVVTWREASVCG